MNTRRNKIKLKIENVFLSVNKLILISFRRSQNKHISMYGLRFNLPLGTPLHEREKDVRCIQQLKERHLCLGSALPQLTQLLTDSWINEVCPFLVESEISCF